MRCLGVNNHIQQDEEIILHLHSSRQPVRVVWVTPTKHQSSPKDDELTAGSPPEAAAVEPIEYCCGVVFLRRKEICVPGIQVVGIRGSQILCAGEIIAMRAARHLTKCRKPGRRACDEQRRADQGTETTGNQRERENGNNGNGTTTTACQGQPPTTVENLNRSREIHVSTSPRHERGGFHTMSPKNAPKPQRAFGATIFTTNTGTTSLPEAGPP